MKHKSSKSGAMSNASTSKPHQKESVWGQTTPGVGVSTSTVVTSMSKIKK